MSYPSLKEGPPKDDSGPVAAALIDRSRRRFVIVAAALACALLAAVAALSLAGGDERRFAAASAQEPSGGSSEEPPPLKLRPKVVRAVGPGEAAPSGGVTAGARGGQPSQGPQTDAEVRAELSQFREHLSTVGTPRGPVAAVQSDGTAVAPHGVPGVVLAVIAAGNEIATKPYKWGGGHGAWQDSGYDCSGSVSFALAGAGLLDSPLNSGGFMTYGKPGPGRWISIYTNPGHMFMVVAGLRFDTSGANGGTRWQAVGNRSYSGFTVRHPPGL